MIYCKKRKKLTIQKMSLSRTHVNFFLIFRIRILCVPATHPIQTFKVTQSLYFPETWQERFAIMFQMTHEVQVMELQSLLESGTVKDQQQDLID